MTISTYKILIVDDEATTRDLISSVLSSKGHRCETAVDGAQALDRALAETFDAVITDIVMPEMDGITLTREVLKINPSLPVMVITGFSDEHYYEDSVNAGASDFINKPFSVAELLARFQKMMRDHEISNQIMAREKELEKIGAEMIAGVQHDSMQRVAALKKEIESLRKNLQAGHAA
ncbi:MAG: response regulator [Nitrospirae bacterium]|nr:response regulator [Nitrospirota bacterium]